MALSTAPTVQAWVNAVVGVDLSPGLLTITPLHTGDGELTGVEYTYPDAPPELLPLSAYRELFVTSRSLSWLYGEPFPFTRIDFPLEQVAPEALTYVAGEVSCGSDALRLWWDPAASTRELPFGNAFQHEAWIRADNQILAEFRASGDWPATVAKTVRASPSLNRKLANVAAALHVSPRTLQRRLGETGKDFAQVRDGALSDLASDLLSNTDQSVARISHSLGYADPPSFTVAFRRWTGVSPSAFRESSRATTRRTDQKNHETKTLELT
jgi:AraC-like DNA-binding protein